jgi:flagellum-specific ATP synthase
MKCALDDIAQFLGSLMPAQDARRLGQVVAFDGAVIEATGLSSPVGTTCLIGEGRDGFAAEVGGFRDKRTILLPYDRAAAIAVGMAVEPIERTDRVIVGPALLGRVIDGRGVALDGGGPVGGGLSWPLEGKPGNPLARASVEKPFDVGVRAINALLTVGEGQRIAIVAGAGVGKSVLMSQMIAGSEADAVVIGLIGERSREVSDFVDSKIDAATRPRTVVVAEPADHAPLLRLRAAMRATAIAEEMRAAGKKVLLVIDSLTRLAHAQREIALGLGEPPAARGYPPSALALIPKLAERAGRDRTSGGSITAIYTVLADGDEANDPVVDTARAIVDGHIVLSRQLAEQGVFPAIDIGRSLSRVMADIVSAAHRTDAAQVRRLWSAYENNRDLILMGAYAPGSDALLDEAIRQRPALLEFVAQGQDRHVTMAESIAALSGWFSADGR